jgi:hypothetical protein
MVHDMITILKPIGYMNVGISLNSKILFMDKNISTEMNPIKFNLPGPKYKWRIYSIKGDKIRLIDTDN